MPWLSRITNGGLPRQLLNLFLLGGRLLVPEPTE